MAGHTNNNSILSKGKIIDSPREKKVAENQGGESTKNKRNKQSVKRISTLNNEVESLDVHSSTLSGKTGHAVEVFSNGGRRGIEN